MADLRPLTQQQQALLQQYYQAREAWESGDWTGYDNPDGTAYAAALNAMLDAGLDPFHYPTPRQAPND